MSKFRKIRRTDHEERVGERSSLQRDVVGTIEGKRPFGREVAYRGIWWGDMKERDRLRVE